MSDLCSRGEGEPLWFVRLSEALARFQWVEWFPFEWSWRSGAGLKRLLSITRRSLPICERRLLVLPFGAMSCHMSLLFTIEAFSFVFGDVACLLLYRRVEHRCVQVGLHPWVRFCH